MKKGYGKWGAAENHWLPGQDLYYGSRHPQPVFPKVGDVVTVYLRDETYKDAPMLPYSCVVVNVNIAHNHYTVMTPWGYEETFKGGCAS